MALSVSSAAVMVSANQTQTITTPTGNANTSKLAFTEVIGFGNTWSLSSTYTRLASNSDAQYDFAVLFVRAVDTTTHDIYEIVVRGITIPILVSVSRDLNEDEVYNLEVTMNQSLIGQCLYKYASLFEEQDKILMQKGTRLFVLQKLGNYVMLIFNNTLFAKIFLSCMINASEDSRAQLFGECFRRSKCYYRKRTGDNNFQEVLITTSDDSLVKQMLANQLRIDVAKPSFTVIELDVTRSSLKQPFFYKLVENSERIYDSSLMMHSSNSNFGSFDGQFIRSSSHISLLPERFEALASSSNSIGLNVDSNTSISLPMDHLSIIDELSRSSTEAPENTLFLTASEVMSKVRYEFNPASVILSSMKQRDKLNKSSNDVEMEKKKKVNETLKKSLHVSTNATTSDSTKSSASKKRKINQTSKSDSGLLQAFLQKRQKLADQQIEDVIAIEQDSANTEENNGNKMSTKSKRSNLPKKKKTSTSSSLLSSGQKRHVSTPSATSWNLTQDEQALRDFFL